MKSKAHQIVNLHAFYSSFDLNTIKWTSLIQNNQVLKT